MVEPGFNLAMEMQMAQRVHRFNQSEDAEVVWLFFEKACDEIQENFMLLKAAPYFKRAELVLRCSRDVGRRSLEDTEPMAPQSKRRQRAQRRRWSPSEARHIPFKPDLAFYCTVWHFASLSSRLCGVKPVRA